MTQPSLLDLAPRFDSGIDLEPADHTRLANQLHRILAVLRDGKWHTVADLSRQTGAPENSCQSQARNLRKTKHGGYTVERKRIGALSYYRLVVEDR